jgi:hypothetical protein
LSGIDRIPIGVPGLFQINLASPLTYYYFVLVVFIEPHLLWRHNREQVKARLKVHLIIGRILSTRTMWG